MSMVLLIPVLIKLNYVLFSTLLLVYGAWHYHKHKEKGLLYLTFAFTFLTCSAIIQLATSLSSCYSIYLDMTTSRLLELSALAMFALFTITTIIALRKLLTPKQQNPTR